MPTLRLLAPLVAAGVLAGLGAPATAPAMPITEVTYRVTLEATATYEHEWFRDHGNSNTERYAVDGTTKTRAVMTDIVFRNGRLLNVRGAGTATIETDGGGTTKRTSKDPNGGVTTETGFCLPEGYGTGGVAELARDEEPSPVPGGGEALVVRMASIAGIGFDCTTLAVPPVAFAKGFPFPQGDTFDVDVQLPAETIGMGKIIQLVSAPYASRSPQFCPGKDQYTVSCAFNWTGKLTFEKTDEQKYGFEGLPPGYGQDEDPLDGVEIPMPPARPGAGGPPAQTPRATPGGRVVTPTIVRRAAKLSRRGLTFTAGCPQGCSGTAVVLGRSGKRLASVRFRVAAGAPKKVTVKLPRRARRSGAKVRVTLKPRIGKPTTATLAVKR